jgi:hypothetical protein
VIYPNPGNDVLFIKSKSDTHILKVVVRDLSGGLVSSIEFLDGDVQITTELWADGVYFIEIQTELGMAYFKWIKQ